MDHTEPQLLSTSELAPVHRSGTTPFSQQTVVLTKQAYIELKWEANYWRAQHARLVEREEALKGGGEALQNNNPDLTQRLYRAKNQKIAWSDPTVGVTPADPPQPRAQPG